MDDNNKKIAELQRLQADISTLFQSILKEKDKCDSEHQNSVTLDTLLAEVIELRRENEILRKSSDDRSFCHNCNVLREKLFIQDERSKKLEKNLYLLRNFLIEVPYEEMSPFQYSSLVKQKLIELNIEPKLSREATGKLYVQQCIGSSADSRSSMKPQCEANVPVGDSSINKSNCFSDSNEVHPEVNKNDNLSTRIFGNDYLQSFEIKNEDKLLPVHEECKTNFDVASREFSTPKKVERNEHFLSIRPDLVSKSGEGSPILLVDQHLPYNRNSIANSPPNYFKRKSNETLSPLKICNKKGTLTSPKRKHFKSPAKGLLSKGSHLKPMNSIEVEVSLSGVRKLKQTQLNCEYYKNKIKENDGENVPEKKPNFLCNDSKTGEDDVILESPRALRKYLNDNARKETERKEVQISGLDIDPEETFVSSFYLKDKEEFKKNDIKTESSIPVTERSPEYDSVPFPYKGNPVRKKSERMKIPGQMCMECNKYYKAVLGEIDQKKLQHILNQCSRHRDRHYNIIDTPPGYWKPYLTETFDATETTFKDDDAFIED